MADVKFISIPSKRLAESIDSSASSIKLNNILGWDGAALTSSDFGSLLYITLRNDQNTILEIMEVDPTTIASSSITILKRGLKFNGDLTTEVSGNKKTWVKNETIIELGTNVPQLLNHMVRINQAQTIAEVKTFSSLPKTSAGDPIDDNDLARKAYVDAVVAGSFPANRVVVAGTAGETVAAGNMLYFDTTDNEWKLADADAAATSENVLLGVAQGAGTNGNSISSGVLLIGLDNNQTGMTEGDIQYLSDTAGEITTTPGTKNVTVGIAKSATELYFSPRFTLALTKEQQDAIPSTTQKAALVGNLGTPGSGNKYVTQLGLQKGAEVYAADAEASDTYVITLAPVPTAYFTGMVIQFKANTANTGAATLNVNTLGAKAIKKKHDTDLANGDIEAGQIVTVVYDGTNFQMQSQIGASDPFNRRLHTFTTAVTFGAPTVTEETIMSFSLAGGLLNTANIVRVRIFISDLDIDAGNFTLKFKYGSTTIITNIITGTPESHKGYIDFDLIADAATNAQNASSIIFTGVDQTGSLTTQLVWRGSGTATEDSTGALNVIVTGQFSSSSGSSGFTALHGYAELIIS